jgi:septum formation protein
MLNMLNGQWHEVITGICLYKTSNSKTILDYELTKVKMAKKSDDFIKWYIGTREPFDKAGAYGIQGFGSMLVERIEGCFFNVMGLPINKLCTKLDELGYSWF